MCVNGKGAPTIAKVLEEKGILNPAAYKTLKGSTRFAKLQGTNHYKWKAVTVRKILTDMVYCGHMENGKYKVENYKTKRRVKVPDNEHIVVKNTHEAIISEETFETVQTVLSARHYPAHHEHENLFKSILFCECGKRMAIAHKVRNNKKDTFYKCANHENNPHECPRSNIIQYHQIKTIIEKEIFGIIERLRHSEKAFETYVNRIKKDESKDKSSEIKKTESRINTLIKIASKLYEDYASDLINERTYKELLLRNKQEQDLLEQKLQSLRNVQENITYKLMRLDQLKNEFNRFLDNVELSSDMVNSLIERIELSYYTKAEDGTKHRRMIIKYKFIDDSL